MFKWILVLIVVAIFTVPSIAKQLNAEDERPTGNLLVRYVRRHGVGRLLMIVLAIVVAGALAIAAVTR